MKVFYLIFLSIFSYVVLVDLHYYDPNQPADESNSTEALISNWTTSSVDYNFTYSSFVKPSDKMRVLRKPSFLEHVISFWVVSLIIEEIRQVSRLEISKVIQV